MCCPRAQIVFDVGHKGGERLMSLISLVLAKILLVPSCCFSLVCVVEKGVVRDFVASSFFLSGRLRWTKLMTKFSCLLTFWMFFSFF